MAGVGVILGGVPWSFTKRAIIFRLNQSNSEVPAVKFDPCLGFVQRWAATIPMVYNPSFVKNYNGYSHRLTSPHTHTILLVKFQLYLHDLPIKCLLNILIR